MTTIDMPKRSKEPLVRTSVQLPGSRLEDLGKAWPELAQSEAIRTALDRHHAIMREASTEVMPMLSDEANAAIILQALEPIGAEAWRMAAIALPQLVTVALVDAGRVSAEDMALVQHLQELPIHHRLAVFDWAVAQRSAS